MRAPPEMTRTGTVGDCRLISSIVSIPSVSGMMMSVITRSGLSFLKRPKPRLPSVA
jgi:hypothetical protein